MHDLNFKGENNETQRGQVSFPKSRSPVRTGDKIRQGNFIVHELIQQLYQLIKVSGIKYIKYIGHTHVYTPTDKEYFINNTKYIFNCI